MRFALFYLAITLWVLWRFLKPMHVAKRYKWIGLAVILVIASFSFVSAAFFGGLISPELPAWVLMVGHGAEFALLFLAALTLVREVVIFLCVLGGKSARPAKRVVQRDRRVALGMMAASAGLAVAGVHEGVKVPDVLSYDVPIEDLPKGLEGMSVVQLSDLHASALLTEPHMEALVERVNELKPDLILITGDLQDGTVENRRKDIAPLAKLRARHGVLACEGNHEHYIDYDGWCRRIPELGIDLLKNECREIVHNGAVLTVGAVTDPWAKRFNRELPDAVKAFHKAPEKGPRILMAHQPKPARTYDEAVRVDLILSGHTHGGQLYGMDYAVAVMNATFVRGWYRLRHAKLYVHSGSGLWNGFPVRLGVPSEIALFTLRKKTADNDKSLPKAENRQKA